jgi:hypothetical protein
MRRKSERNSVRQFQRELKSANIYFFGRVSDLDQKMTEMKDKMDRIEVIVKSFINCYIAGDAE